MKQFSINKLMLCGLTASLLVTSCTKQMEGLNEDK